MKGRDEPSAPTYLLGLTVCQFVLDKSLYSLAEWARHDLALTSFGKRIHH